MCLGQLESLVMPGSGCLAGACSNKFTKISNDLNDCIIQSPTFELSAKRNVLQPIQYSLKIILLVNARTGKHDTLVNPVRYSPAGA